MQRCRGGGTRTRDVPSGRDGRGVRQAMPLLAAHWITCTQFISNYIGANEVEYHSPEPEPKPQKKPRHARGTAESLEDAAT